MPVCPICKGYDTQERAGSRFREALRLLGRANQVLKLDLSTEDREFVVDLVLRLSDGAPPRWIDFFKLQEIYDHGTGTKRVVFIPSDYHEAELPPDVIVRRVPGPTASKPELKLIQGGSGDHVVAGPKDKSKDPRRDPD
jgi:hypothetical protein